MKKDILSTEEIDAVKGIISTDCLNDYNSLNEFYTKVDTRDETERALNHTKMIRHVTPSMELFHEFKKTVDAEIEKIMADDVYDARQKKIMIDRITSEKGQEYKDKINERMADYTDKASQLKEYLAQVVNATEKLTPAQMRENEYIARELDAETKTSLMTAFAPDQVLAIFNKQMDMAKHNQAKARFLHKNAYLHMERIHATGSDRSETNRAITEIQKGLNRLEKYAYTPGQIGMKKMMNNSTTFTRTGQEGIRAINNWLKYAK